MKNRPIRQELKFSYVRRSSPIFCPSTLTTVTSFASIQYIFPALSQTQTMAYSLRPHQPLNYRKTCLVLRTGKHQNLYRVNSNSCPLYCVLLSLPSFFLWILYPSPVSPESISFLPELLPHQPAA